MDNLDNLDNLDLGPPAEGHDKGHCSWLRLYGQWSEATVINQDSGKGTYLLVLALSNNTPFQKKTVLASELAFFRQLSLEII